MPKLISDFLFPLKKLLRGFGRPFQHNSAGGNLAGAFGEGRLTHCLAGCFWARQMLWAFLYIASFTFVCHLLWFYFVPAWLPLRRFLSGLPFIMLLLVPALGPRRLARAWLVLLYPTLIIPAVICSQHIFLFHTPISSQSFYVIFETNSTESLEFLLAQTSLGTIFLFLLTLLLPLLCLRKFWRLPCVFTRKNAAGMSVLFAGALALLGIYGQERVFKSNMAYDFYASYYLYEKNKAQLQAFVAKADKIHFPDVRSDLAGDPERTLVVVIGESANRHHHQLYGYHRPTNPRLMAIKNELLLFDNVISSHSQTIPTVREAMSFTASNSTTPCAINTKNTPEGLPLPLLSLFKQAGFETVWLSNQVSFENSYTEIAVLTSMADKRINLNRGGDQSYIRNFDEIVLPEFEKILHTPPPGGKRVIFVHLMGSHLNYASRYPPEFERFTSTSDLASADWRREKDKTYINKYDNSILYTDFVLGQMIELLRQNVPNSALVYFSDHGEEVYDSLPGRGHTNALKSPYYFDIPFVVWLSQPYRQVLGAKVAAWQKATRRPVVNTMFPYTAAELAGIAWNDSRRSQGLLAPDFKAMPRNILEGNYDQTFPNRPRNNATFADQTPCVFP